MHTLICRMCEYGIASIPTPGSHSTCATRFPVSKKIILSIRKEAMPSGFFDPKHSRVSFTSALLEGIVRVGGCLIRATAAQGGLWVQFLAANCWPCTVSVHYYTHNINSYYAGISNCTHLWCLTCLVFDNLYLFIVNSQNCSCMAVCKHCNQGKANIKEGSCFYVLG